MGEQLVDHFSAELAMLDELHRHRVLSQLQSIDVQERIAAVLLLQRMKHARYSAESV